MPLDLNPKPILYLITSGATTQATNPNSPEFSRILHLIEAAVAARISLIQLREKNLHARTLFELTLRAARLMKGSATRLLVNDRADIALAAGADGVHLAATSLSASVIRRNFPKKFLIGVSTHSLNEAQEARDNGADFAVFGPVFDTPSKRTYGEPLGLDKLREAAQSLRKFPLVAIGGITLENLDSTLRAGTKGIAAIRLFNNTATLASLINSIRAGYSKEQ
ncbi:MAG: thiamine-phosphate diphosphorylase [Acidobacteria bacterium 13_1_20CM_3_53_8]|nr:MAG: thiamine-phosphate diphosphorylase [Acidobacteria bacterium 13_1_20CM_3_53_8]